MSYNSEHEKYSVIDPYAGRLKVRRVSRLAPDWVVTSLLIVGGVIIILLVVLIITAVILAVIGAAGL